MKVSKKMRNKRKKTLLTVLAGTALLTSIVAATKFIGLETSIQKLIQKSPEKDEQITYSQTNSDSNQTTTNLDILTNSVKENVKIANGNNFTAVLKADGTVWTWGNNNYGQLGNGEIENSATYTLNQVIGVNAEGYLSNIKQIAAGTYEMYALTNDGKVICWGRGAQGQHGNGDTQNSGTPVYAQTQVDITDEEGNINTEDRVLENIKQIAAGSSHVLALSNDGTVYTWGLNNYGQLGIGVAHTTASNVNGKRIYAVKVQKEIEITDEEGNITTQLADLDRIKQVSGGNDFSVALTQEGSVLAWGLGTSGQIGNSAAANVTLPTPVTDLENVTKIDAGGLHTLALKEDGTVWAWGLNRYGQLGINTASTTSSNAAYKRTYPVQVLKAAGTPLTDVIDISANLETSYAITEDETAYGWGLNTSGQIGDNTATNKYIATQIIKYTKEPITGIKMFSEGQNTNTNYLIDEKGYIYANGVSTSYQLLSDRVTNNLVATPVDETYLKLSHNQAYLEVENTVDLQVSYHNGLNVINKALTPENITYRTSNEEIATVDNNGKVTAKSRGYVTIIAEDTTNGYIAQSIINVIAKGATALPQVVSGTITTVYLKEDGTVWASGSGANGTLGSGYNKIVNKPVQVTDEEDKKLTDIRKIEIGTEHVIALKKDGTVWTWGVGTTGQIGDGAAANRYYATQVVDETGEEYLSDIIDVAAGLDYCLALKADGTVVGWGAGANHALGVNNTGNKVLPVKMHDSYNIIQVQGGSDTSTVLKANGKVQAVRI
jgi:alpha-tubulin suppressor-like RCC1 family protein